MSASSPLWPSSWGADERPRRRAAVQEALPDRPWPDRLVDRARRARQERRARNRRLSTPRRRFSRACANSGSRTTPAAISKRALQGADLVILCVPVGAIGAAARTCAPYLERGAILSDVGSVKGSVSAQVAPHVPPGVHFVPAHPLAGTEYSGPDSGFSTLFENRWCLLTPTPETDAGMVEELAEFWKRLGAKVEATTPEHHDLALAVTSHLPHLIAFNIVGTAAHLETVTQSEVIKFSASGFRDFTRIAASDPTMWRDVFLHNKDAVLDMLGRFNADLKSLQGMIEQGDGQGLFDLFTRTRAIRKGIVEQGQDTAAPDFGRAQAGKGPRPS